MRTNLASALLFTWLAALGAACGEYRDPTQPPPPPPIDQQLRQLVSNYGTVPIGPMPAQDPALVDLGQSLFFDPVLSGNRDIACATCPPPPPQPGAGRPAGMGPGGGGVGAAGVPGGGRQFIPRRAPSLLNKGL